MSSEESDGVYQLADIAGVAQAEFQKDFDGCDPVIGIMRSMRDAGFAADAMTIDCLVSGKRILCILHDNAPEAVDYLFGHRNKDPDMNFNKIALAELTEKQFYLWMKSYFIDQA